MCCYKCTIYISVGTFNVCGGCSFINSFIACCTTLNIIFMWDVIMINIIFIFCCNIFQFPAAEQCLKFQPHYKNRSWKITHLHATFDNQNNTYRYRYDRIWMLYRNKLKKIYHQYISRIRGGNNSFRSPIQFITLQNSMFTKTAFIYVCSTFRSSSVWTLAIDEFTYASKKYVWWMLCFYAVLLQITRNHSQVSIYGAGTVLHCSMWMKFLWNFQWPYFIIYNWFFG